MIILILHKRKLSLTVFWWKFSPDHVAGKPQNEEYDLSSDSPPKLLFLEKWNQVVEKCSIWMQLAVVSVQVFHVTLGHYGISLSTQFIIKNIGIKMTKWLNQLLNVLNKS